MADIQVKYDIDSQNVVQGRLKVRFDQFDADLKAKLIPVIANAGRQLYENVRAAAPEETGSLRNAISTNLASGAGWARVYVEVNPEHGEPFNVKGAALEYGAHRLSKVLGYTRTVDQIFGEARSPVEQVVSPYSRTPNIEELSYLRGGFTDDLEASFSAAVEEALGGAAEAFNE